jgi:hypothetical protein
MTLNEHSTFEELDAAMDEMIETGVLGDEYDRVQKLWQAKLPGAVSQKPSQVASDLQQLADEARRQAEERLRAAAEAPSPEEAALKKIYARRAEEEAEVLQRQAQYAEYDDDALEQKYASLMAAHESAKERATTTKGAFQAQQAEAESRAAFDEALALKPEVNRRARARDRDQQLTNYAQQKAVEVLKAEDERMLAELLGDPGVDSFTKAKAQQLHDRNLRVMRETGTHPNADRWAAANASIRDHMEARVDARERGFGRRVFDFSRGELVDDGP